jgi:ribosomal protein S18 acetylase RimI-like enzyme
MIIREIRTDELPLLETFLYEAIFVPEGVAPLPFDTIFIPAIYAYIKDFGSRKDDYCLVAETDGGQVVGAVWVRILAGTDGEAHGFGNLDAETPEFAISVLKGFRNQGIGACLMEEMLNYLKDKGYRQTSLSVQKENYAARMYLKLGFEIVSENREDFIMVRHFQ